MAAGLKSMAMVLLAFEEGPVTAAENLGNRYSVQRETARRESQELKEFCSRTTYASEDGLMRRAFPRKQRVISLIAVASAR